MTSSARRIALLFTVASGSWLALACGETRPPATTARSAVPSRAPATSSAPAAAKDATSDVRISDEIRSQCGISDEDAYFTFNSASVTSRDRTPLDLVARCFISGPLKGRAVKLVGRADPRGALDYNVTLGQSRADAVESYLTSHGMNKGKTQTTSRGAMDAVGSDEASWQHDRRVDVLLAD